MSCYLLGGIAFRLREHDAQLVLSSSIDNHTEPYLSEEYCRKFRDVRVIVIMGNDWLRCIRCVDGIRKYCAHWLGPEHSL